MSRDNEKPIDNIDVDCTILYSNNVSTKKKCDNCDMLLNGNPYDIEKHIKTCQERTKSSHLDALFSNNEEDKNQQQQSPHHNTTSSKEIRKKKRKLEQRERQRQVTFDNHPFNESYNLAKQQENEKIKEAKLNTLKQCVSQIDSEFNKLTALEDKILFLNIIRDAYLPIYDNTQTHYKNLGWQMTGKRKFDETGIDCNSIQPLTPVNDKMKEKPIQIEIIEKQEGKKDHNELLQHNSLLNKTLLSFDILVHTKKVNQVRDKYKETYQARPMYHFNYFYRQYECNPFYFDDNEPNVKIVGRSSCKKDMFIAMKESISELTKK